MATTRDEARARLRNQHAAAKETVASRRPGYRPPPPPPQPRGPAGKDGRDGVDGKDGLDGRDGAAAYRGLPGARGLDGRDGKPGPVGRTGPAGKDGMQGPRGLAGKDGRDGRDGLHGEDGKDGLIGPRGLAGKDGKDGKDGKQGKQGPKGLRGLKGEKAPPCGCDHTPGARYRHKGLFAKVDAAPVVDPNPTLPANYVGGVPTVMLQSEVYTVPDRVQVLFREPIVMDVGSVIVLGVAAHMVGV